MRSSTRRRSAVFAQAVELWHETRDEFEDYRLAAFAIAEEACRGTMLNARGKRAGIDPLSLFMGNTARAHAYASAELVEHWRTHTRPVFADFERDRVEMRPAS